MALETSSWGGLYDVKVTFRKLSKKMRLGSALLWLETRKSIGLTWKGKLKKQWPTRKIVILLRCCRDGYHLMPHLLLFFKRAYEISRFCWLGWGKYKNPELKSKPLICKKKLIGNVNYVASYALLHNDTHVLGRRLSSSSIVKKVNFISQKAKCNISWYLKTMG